MDAIEILIEEHKPIKIVLRSIRKLCLDITNGEKVDYDLFTDIIDFIRNYADKYHHQKEENHLFNKIEEIADYPPNTGPIVGMLLEHDLGRSYIRDLEKALATHKSGDEEAKLDIIANAISYEKMLQDHIAKEDDVIFQMGNRVLSQGELNRLEKLFKEIESDPENIKIRDKYVSFAESLQKNLQLH